jgi:hypothetical protein
VLLALAACWSEPAPRSSEPTLPPATVMAPKPHPTIRVIVRDYAENLVDHARVTYTVDGTHVDIRTDRFGEVRIRAPIGTTVSASKHDMMGHAKIAGDTLEIEMMQMPM